MTTIIKTPKHPLTVAKPTDPWEKVRVAAERCAEARKRAARVGQQVGFTFHEGSHKPMHADAHQSWDELYKATVEFKEACTAWLQLQAPIGNATCEPVPQVCDRALVAKQAPRAKAPRFPQEQEPALRATAALWPESATRWLTGVCSTDTKSPFYRRFLLDRPMNAISKQWVGATNSHVLVVLATAPDTAWPTFAGVPAAPTGLSPGLNAAIKVALNAPTLVPVARGVQMSRLLQWAPNAYVRGEDIEGLVERGTIQGVHVNRRLVRAAMWVLGVGCTVDIFVDAVGRCVRIESESLGYQALIMGRNPAPEEVRGPELLA